MRMLQPADEVGLGLMAATIDSVEVDGVATMGYVYDRRQLMVPVAGAAEGDTVRVKVHYGSSGWHGTDGGFWCDADKFYNLGEDRRMRPFSMGRSWFPCSDSVYDRATYHFAITAAPGWSAFCSGEHDSTVVNSDSSRTFYYTLAHPISTYLAGVNVAQYQVYRRDVQGLYGTYPLRVAFLGQVSLSQVAQSFAQFDSTLVRFERWFGPYRWGGIGFSVGGENAGMEHVNNICVRPQLLPDNLGTEYLIDHEFAHQWFGNLITCDNLRDIWFNEGGATFADQYVTGNTHDRYEWPYYSKHYLMASVPKDEDGFQPLCGMPNQYSFMSSTYYKGAYVFHEMRHLLGDSLFFGMLRTLFERNAFTNMDSYQLRDSMSRYCGVDLTPFYDFHIFAPGFTSYRIDSLRTVEDITTVWLSQLLWGAPEYNTLARVPVTFFSAEGDSATCDVHVRGRYARGEFRLPFLPKYAVVDYYSVIACANINNDVAITSSSPISLSPLNMEIRPTHVSDTSKINVSLQLGRADEPRPTGLVRWGSRRWAIHGNVSGVNGNIRFFFGNNNTVNDLDFCPETATYDSVRLFYRKDASQPWRQRKSATMGNGGSLGMRYHYMEYGGLLEGEYIMAVVYTNLLSIDAERGLTMRERPLLSLAPNPAHGCTEVSIGGMPAGGTLRVLDATGREMLRMPADEPRFTLSTTGFDAGLYFVTYTSAGGTCTQKLVVQ